jgi:hypothetical protein
MTWRPVAITISDEADKRTGPESFRPRRDPVSIVRTVLRAQWISTPVVDSLAGRVVAGSLHSVYRRAVNLVLDGHLITLVRSEAGKPPNGLVVQSERDFLALGLEPGMAVLGDEAAMWVPAVDLLVDIGAATAWSPRLPAFPMASGDRVSANLGLAAGLSADVAPEAGFGPLLRLLPSRLGRCQEVFDGGDTPTIARSDVAPSRHFQGLSEALQESHLPNPSPLCMRAWPAILAVLKALETAGPRAAAAEARGLIGLGIGLTPSGDDFLVGLSAALAAVGHPWAGSFAADYAEAARGRTTPISEALMDCAARGWYGGQLHDLLGSILTGCERSVQDQLMAMMGWGATSGVDGLLGVLLGVALAIETMGWTVEDGDRGRREQASQE